MSARRTQPRNRSRQPYNRYSRKASGKLNGQKGARPRKHPDLQKVQAPPKKDWKNRLPLISVVATSTMGCVLAGVLLYSCLKPKTQIPGQLPPTRETMQVQKAQKKVQTFVFLLRKQRQLKDARRRAFGDLQKEEFEEWERSLPLKPHSQLEMEWKYHTWALMHSLPCAPNDSACKKAGSADSNKKRLALQEEIEWRQDDESAQPGNPGITPEERFWIEDLNQKPDSEISTLLDEELRVVSATIKHYAEAIEAGDEGAASDAVMDSRNASWKVDALIKEANARACKRAQERESGNPGQ